MYINNNEIEGIKENHLPQNQLKGKEHMVCFCCLNRMNTTGKMLR